MFATSTVKHHLMSGQRAICAPTVLSTVKVTQALAALIRGIKFSAIALTAGLILTLAACQAPAPPPVAVPTGPTPEQIAQKEKRERAAATLADGVKQYDTGAYDEAMNSFLVALDTGSLSVTEQLVARKTMAFMHCIAGRESRCKGEFERAVTLNQKFELSAAEAGHPTWGPVFKTVVIEADLRRRGVVIPAAPPKATPAQMLQADAMKAYDDGNFELAAKLYLELQKQTITAEILSTARKFAAFSYCLIGKNTLCRAEFQKLLDSNPAFALSPAEAGHPSWGSTFRSLAQKNRMPATTPANPAASAAPSAAKPAAPK